MHTNELDAIEQIETRLAAIQQSHIALQEQIKQAENDLERHINDSALRVIDILDMIDTVQSKITVDGAPLVVKKIEKRLNDILRRWQVQEINLTDGRVEAGKTRVLETRQTTDETPKGTIIEICRKGYQRGEKTIRTADVITSEHPTRTQTN
jgi:molecular chaperone GrpE (heat shock protein)